MLSIIFHKTAVNRVPFRKAEIKKEKQRKSGSKIDYLELFVTFIRT